MTRILECVEPGRRPVKRSLTVLPGETVHLVALERQPGAPDGLRRTVLRRDGEDPPSGAMPVASFLIDATGLVAREVSPDVVLELSRASVRSQVVSGMRLPNNGLYELALPDQSRVPLGLSLERALERGASYSVAGSGTRRSRVRYAEDNVWWVITDGPGIVGGIGRKAIDNTREWFTKHGIEGRVFSFAASFLTGLAVAGYYAYQQQQEALEATERANALQEQLELAQAAQAASLQTELACLSDRKGLVAELGQKAEQQALLARMALDLPLTRQVALELGGSRMASEPVRELDGLLEPLLMASVQARMPEVGGDLRACLAQDTVLGADLPRYLLAWHPDPTLTCPLDYVSEEGGVKRAGRWGLSDRVAREFGRAGHSGTGTTPEAMDGVVDDARYEDRWSAFTLALAYRTVSEALLRTRRTQRPPTLPGQAQLWSLALLDAYNRLGSPAGGVLDDGVGNCIDRLLEATVRDAEPAAAGTPLLPDLSAVAAGAEVLPLVPTPGCAWPTDAIAKGADAALRAAARLARAEQDADAAAASGGPP